MSHANDDVKDRDVEIPIELSDAGAIVDHAIKHMLERELPPMAIASALLGGSLCLLARTMGDEAVLQVLHNAAAGVRAGDLQRR